MRKKVAAMVLVAFLAMTSLALAADVMVTKSGKKYHKETCQLIKNKETTKMDDSEAVKQGYTPCAKCFKADKADQVKGNK